VQSVPAPPLVARPARRTLAAAALLAAGTVGLALAASSPSEPAATHVYNGLIGGVPLQQARCVQWNAGTGAERDNVAAALSHSVGGGTPYGPGSTLTSSQAHGLFDRACSSPIAQNWLLYELYIRAAGFHSYLPR
jgi:hypothetical protein